jgi:hypothetical protein
MIGFYYAERIFFLGGWGEGSRMKNESEIEPKIYFRHDFMLTTQFVYTKQCQAVLAEKDEIRACSYFI